jgi:hypothetical protein
MWLGDRCIYEVNLSEPTNAFRFMNDFLMNKRNESNHVIRAPFHSNETDEAE